MGLGDKGRDGKSVKGGGGGVVPLDLERAGASPAVSRVMHGGRDLGVMGVTSVGESRRERQSGWGRWVGVVKKEEWWVVGVARG